LLYPPGRIILDDFVVPRHVPYVVRAGKKILTMLTRAWQALVTLLRRRREGVFRWIRS
jgi:hypothetical protein